MNFELSPSTVSDSRAPWNFFGKVQSQTVLVDSRDRDSVAFPSPNNYRVHLPKPLRNVSSARLVSAELPGTFYVFTSARANTSIRITGGGATHTVTIPDGNYDSSTMLSTLKDAINTAFSGDGVVFDITLSQTTMKYTLSCTSHPGGTVTVNCAAGAAGVGTSASNWGLGYYLGFAKTSLSGTGTVTAPGIANLRPENYLLLKIRGLDSVCECGLEGSKETRSAFAKIPFTVSSFGINFFDKLLTDNVLNPVHEKLAWLDISIEFHDGTAVEFVGAGDHSFTLEFYCNRFHE